MLNKIKFIHILCLVQAVVLVTTARRMDDVVQNYAEIIHKMTEQVKNFTEKAYRNSSEQVLHVLNNNTFELTQAKDFLRQMHSGKEKVLIDTGMGFFPQMTKECQDNFDQASEDLSKIIADSEDVCLIFISNVFTLVENPVLYKNISDLQLQIESIQTNCTNTTYVSVADNCFNEEINVVMQPKIREMRKNVHAFLESVARKVTQMTFTLHKCYSTIKNEVLIKKVRHGIRNFRQCVSSKNVNHTI